MARTCLRSFLSSGWSRRSFFAPPLALASASIPPGQPPDSIPSKPCVTNEPVTATLRIVPNRLLDLLLSPVLLCALHRRIIFYPTRKSSGSFRRSFQEATCFFL